MNRSPASVGGVPVAVPIASLTGRRPTWQMGPDCFESPRTLVQSGGSS